MDKNLKTKLVLNLKERYYLGDLAVDGSTILKLFLDNPELAEEMPASKEICSKSLR
jgi:hypothetical protein